MVLTSGVGECERRIPGHKKEREPGRSCRSFLLVDAVRS